jgi:hypothetical protein
MSFKFLALLQGVVIVPLNDRQEVSLGEASGPLPLAFRLSGSGSLMNGAALRRNFLSNSQSLSACQTGCRWFGHGASRSF